MSYFSYPLVALSVLMLAVASINAQGVDEVANTDPATLRISIPCESVAASPGIMASYPALRLPRLGLALSGGGARGLAQVGVLMALEEHGIRPDLIVGTSIGSVIGGLYAAGYSSKRLEKTVRSLNWDEVLRLRDFSDRGAVFVDQKASLDRSILTIRLDRLQPVLPTSVSNGQRLTNALYELTVQGLYHSDDFDKLGIPFRAIATDLHSGRSVVLRDGSLADAMRASSAIPVMYSPLRRDTMLLVDGGLLCNIPARVAREEGCDIVIAVNTASPPRSPDQITNALETLDQVFNVMMGAAQLEQLAYADILIEPELGTHLATNFGAHDSLIHSGYQAGLAALPAIRELLISSLVDQAIKDIDEHTGTHEVMIFASGQMDDSWCHTARTLRECVTRAVELMLTDEYEQVHIDVQAYSPTVIRIEALPRPVISKIHIRKSRLLDDAVVSEIGSRWTGRPLSNASLQGIVEDILEEYRLLGISLARLDSLHVKDGVVDVSIDEGRIAEIRVSGNTRTNTVVILREVPIRPGHVFRISAVREGLRNLSGLPIFHHVAFDVLDGEAGPILTIRVVERSSQMLQVGLRVDNERNAQLGVTLRDASIFGTGSEVNASFFSGARNRRYGVEYRSNRIFYTPFNVSLEGYHELTDYNSFSDVPDLPAHRFARTTTSMFRAIGYGLAASAGLYAERFGDLRGTIRYEQQQLRTFEMLREDASTIDEDHGSVSIALTATIDTQDKYPYPHSGMYFKSEYASAQSALGSDVAFFRLSSLYQFYVPLLNNSLVVNPRLLFGYGDKMLPRYEEFRLGGLESFIGMRENEFAGRQIVVVSAVMRYRLPVSILFDSYLSLRYDVGRTWANPELVRFQDLRHGAGLILGLDTPIGPADFAIGRSFYFVRNNPVTPVRWGPTNVYFSIGVEL